MKLKAFDQLLTTEQHSDFIWTWKSNEKGAKVSIWIPYFSGVEKIPRSKLWQVSYNGGALKINLEQVDFIMFYGATGSIPITFLDALAQHKISFMIHRRNLIQPYVFFPSNIGDNIDVLSKQIVYRNNHIKKCYIAKCLLHSRFAKMEKLIVINETTKKALKQAKTLSKIRNIEAVVSARYWDAWYGQFNIKSARRSEHPLSVALDAGSKFLYGSILRWVLFHKLSPCHGYLHEPTSYPSLIYDLMESFRYLIEDATRMAWKTTENNSQKLTAKTLAILKELLEETVYVPATRQYIRRKNLLHGSVLALRAYLLGNVKRLVLPSEGEKKGGRPPKTGYRMPGSLSGNRNGRNS